MRIKVAQHFGSWKMAFLHEFTKLKEQNLKLIGVPSEKI